MPTPHSSVAGERAVDKDAAITDPSDIPSTTPPGQPESPPPRLSRSTLARFLAVFALLVAGYYVLSGTAHFRERFFPAYLVINARLSSIVLNVFGQSTRVSENTVFSSLFSIDVERGCDAIEPTVLFLAAVLASPVSFKFKLPGLLVGTLALAAVNLLRLVSLFLTGIYWPAAFHVMHVDVWQAIFIFLALLFWIIWALWAVKRPLGRPA